MDRSTLETFGYAVEVDKITTKDGKVIRLKSTPHMDYRTSDGRILRGLPADPYHMARYLSRGLKPINSKPSLVCEVCGKEFKHKIALAGHMRTHTSKKEVKDELS